MAAIAAAAAAYGVLFALYSANYLLEFTVPLILLAALVIWVLPDTRRGPVRTLEWLFFGFLMVLILWPDYLAVALPGLPWITMRRIVAAPLALILLICISSSSAVRKEVKASLSFDPLVARLMIAFIVIQFLSIALSRNVAGSIEKFIVAQLYWSAVFFAGCYIFRQPGRVGRWAAFLCLMLVPLGLIGLMEWSRSQVPWAGRIPWFLKVEDEAVIRILTGAARAATGKYRVQSTFTTSLGYAEYLAMATPFLIHFSIAASRLFARIAAMAALPIVFFLIVLTDSRLGVAGFFLSFLVYLAIWAAARWRSEAKSLFGPAITLAYPAIFALFIAATLFVGRLRRMVWGGGEHQASTDARSLQYDRGLDIIMGNPLGHGIGRGAETLGMTNLAGVLTIDTYYLLIALEYGVIGFFVYYGLLLLVTARAGLTILFAGKADREMLYLIPLATSIAVFIVIKSVFSQEANHPLVFMMMAAIIALASRARAPAMQAAAGRQPVLVPA